MRMARTQVRAIAILAGLAVLLVLATLFFGSSAAKRWLNGPQEIAFHGRDVSKENWGGPFTLTDMSNQPRSLSDFRGKVVLLSFGYTHCPDVCPTTLAKFAEVRRLLGADGARVQGIFVTIDPDRDSAELLRNYVPAFDPTFIGLRGSEEQTDAVTKSFHANYQIIDYKGTTLVDHTASTYIVDPEGKVRVFTPYDQSARELADDVASLLRQG
jgi:protein SCO1/2